VQPAQLSHDEEQKDPYGKVPGEKILQILQEAYGAQRSENVIFLSPFRGIL
jgi:hypothetical protein